MFHVNNSISLDVVHVWVLYAQLFAISLCSADDAGGDSVLQGERAANGNHKLSWPQISRTAQRQHAKFLLLQQAQKKPTQKIPAHRRKREYVRATQMKRRKDI